MIDSTDAVVIMEGPVAELQRAARLLAAAGIEAEVVCPEAGRGSS